MPSKKSPLQLYADECFPYPSVTYLRSKGISIIHAKEKRTLGKTDLHHLRVSKILGRILITVDRDFLYYDQADLKNHPGVIIISATTPTPFNINFILNKQLSKMGKGYTKHSLVRITTGNIKKKSF